VISYSDDPEIRALNWYPVFSAIVYLSGLIGFLGFILYRKDRGFSSERDKIIWIAASFLVLNMLFSIYAAPIVLRYQISPIFLCFVFGLMTLEYIDYKEILYPRGNELKSARKSIFTSDVK
jgi:hypothetical protein